MRADRTERLRRRLLGWGDEHGRDYPWRRTRDPYAILVAEFMLHRTQARQAQAVYEQFMARWPTLTVYAAADEEALKAALYPLGLGWRIEGMMAALRIIHERYGEVPTDEATLLAVPGIGPYIAAAVHCFALNEPVALVDTNTVRVTGRVYGLSLQGEARRRKEMIGQIGAACDPERPAEYYFSMIDLAHLICRPQRPACEVCPVREAPCEYGQALTGKTGNEGPIRRG